MSFTTMALMVAGLSVGIALVLLFLNQRLKRLGAVTKLIKPIEATVPVKPTAPASESPKLLSIEARTGILLRSACLKNDAKAASEALTMWAWASGDSPETYSREQKLETLNHPGFRAAIKELWLHLEAEDDRQWSGTPLWKAFLLSNPEFRQLEITR